MSEDDEVIACEGRCGTRLFSASEADGALRERGIVEPKIGDWAPFHTVDRCRGIRALREALESRVPDANVDISPGFRVETLDVHVDRVEGAMVHGVHRTLRDLDVIHGRRPWIASVEADDIRLKFEAARKTAS